MILSSRRLGFPNRRPKRPGKGRVGLIGAVAWLICLAVAFPAGAQSLRSPDSNADINTRTKRLYTENGGVIEVRYRRILATPAKDRSDICFSCAGNLLGIRTIVLDNAHYFTFDGHDAGPKCVTYYNDFDYESYDMYRNRKVAKGRRGRAFGRRALSPQKTHHRLDFYQGPQLEDKYNVLKSGWMFPPGWEITFIWLTDHGPTGPTRSDR